MNKPLISVIIPIYNVGSYIEKCLDSLFNQTLQSDIEYIFIDDCSTDNSIEILQEYFRKYPHRHDQSILISNSINKGVAKSRQLGLEQASGEYIIHCDPDDWTEYNCYESLINEARQSKADIVICDYNEVIDLKVRPIKQNLKDLSSDSILKRISGRENKIWGVLWNKLISSKIYKQYTFDPDINFCEDVLILFKIFAQDLKIVYLPKNLYYYRKVREGSEKKELSQIALDRDIKLYDKISALSLASKSPSYVLSCNSFIQEQIVSRAFRFSSLSDLQYKERYSKYFSNGRINHSFPPLIYFFVFMSNKGYHKLFRNIFNTIFLILK